MPCNNKKDFTKLVSKRRIPLFESRYFFDAYLWRDAPAMRANEVEGMPGDPWHVVPVTDESNSRVEAFVCRMPEVGKIPARTWWRWLLLHCAPESIAARYIGIVYRHTPKLGEIHFYAGNGWGMEVVSHECCHAAITAAHAFQVNPAFVFDASGQLSDHFADTPAMKGMPGASLNDEELFCYIHGTIFAQVYKWLWAADTPSGYEKAAA